MLDISNKFNFLQVSAQMSLHHDSLPLSQNEGYSCPPFIALIPPNISFVYLTIHYVSLLAQQPPGVETVSVLFIVLSLKLRTESGT